MTTKQIVEAYFDALKRGGAWSELLAADLKFVSHVVPQKIVDGKAAFIESTKRFYSMIAGIDVSYLIIEGDRACALTHYRLKVPNGPLFVSEVAEIFTVRNGQICGLDIYFDSSPFPK